MSEITKSELKMRIGVRSDTTLANWQAAGLIPKGMTKSSPNGRGTTGYYPIEIVNVCLEIKRLTREGKSLREVREVLDAKRTTSAPSRKSRGPRGKTSRSVDLGTRRIWIADRVVKESKKIARFVRDTRAPQLITDELIEEAARLAIEGHSPVLVIGADESFVIADYRAGSFVAKHLATEAVLMIPLRELFAEELENATRVFSPVEKVSKSEVTVDEQGNRSVSSQEVFDIADDGHGRFLRFINLG